MGNNTTTETSNIALNNKIHQLSEQQFLNANTTMNKIQQQINSLMLKISKNDTYQFDQKKNDQNIKQQIDSRFIRLIKKLNQKFKNQFIDQVKINKIIAQSLNKNVSIQNQKQRNMHNQQIIDFNKQFEEKLNQQNKIIIHNQNKLNYILTRNVQSITKHIQTTNMNTNKKIQQQNANILFNQQNISRISKILQQIEAKRIQKQNQSEINNKKQINQENSNKQIIKNLGLNIFQIEVNSSRLQQRLESLYDKIQNSIQQVKQLIDDKTLKKFQSIQKQLHKINLKLNRQYKNSLQNEENHKKTKKNNKNLTKLQPKNQQQQILQINFITTNDNKIKDIQVKKQDEQFKKYEKVNETNTYEKVDDIKTYTIIDKIKNQQINGNINVISTQPIYLIKGKSIQNKKHSQGVNIQTNSKQKHVKINQIDSMIKNNQQSLQIVKKDQIINKNINQLVLSEKEQKIDQIKEVVDTKNNQNLNKNIIKLIDYTKRSDRININEQLQYETKKENKNTISDSMNLRILDQFQTMQNDKKQQKLYQILRQPYQEILMRRYYFKRLQCSHNSRMQVININPTQQVYELNFKKVQLNFDKLFQCKWSNIKILKFSDVIINSNDMSMIFNGYKSFPNLKILAIKFQILNMFNINGINGMNTPKIKSLKVFRQNLTNFSQLQSLSLFGNYIEIVTIEDLQKLETINKLKYISLQHNKRLTNQSKKVIEEYQSRNTTMKIFY